MKKSALAAAAACATVTALGVPSTTSYAEQSASAAAPTAARSTATTGWVPISEGKVDIIVQSGIHRAQDGTLHTTYVRTEPDHRQTLAHTAVTPAGTVAARHDLVNWVTLGPDPEIIPGPGGGMRALFTGSYSTETGQGGIFSSGRMYNAVSDASGSSWTLPAESLGRSGAWSSYGSDGVALSDGTPVAVKTPYGTALSWSVGTVSDEAPEPHDPSFSTNGATMFASLARVGDSVYASWMALGNDDQSAGIHVRQVHPTLGPDIKAPESGTKEASNGLLQDVALATSSTGQLYVAYPTQGYPTRTFNLMNVTTGQVTASWKSESGFGKVAMSPGPDGRMWLAWKSASDEVSAARTNRAGTALGLPVRMSLPGEDVTPVYQLAASSGGGFLDAVVNNGAGIWLHRFLPGLELKASPTRWRAGRQQAVRVKVSDAGDAVRGARVKAAGKSCTTDGRGACTLRLVVRRPGKVVVTATATGYAPAAAKLRVLR